jgi:hypothetical protein
VVVKNVEIDTKAKTARRAETYRDRLAAPSMNQPLAYDRDRLQVTEIDARLGADYGKQDA